MTRQDRCVLGVIALVFMAAAAYPLWRARKPVCAEVVQTIKMMDYGFVARRGAVVLPGLSQGRLAHPEAFNYTHHPYLGYCWIFAAIYGLVGPTGIVAFSAAVALFNSLLSYRVFRYWFDVGPAAVAAILYALAPCFQVYASEPSNFNLANLAWPIGTLLFMRRSESGSPQTGRGVWTALFALLAVQVSWFTLTLFPTFLAMSAVPEANLKKTVCASACSRVWRALVIGGALGLLLFVAQVVVYSPSLMEPLRYAGSLARPGQAGFAPDRVRMLGALSARAVVLAGPLLWLGLPLGFYLTLKRRLGLPLVAPMFLYLAVWAGLALSLPLKFATDAWGFLCLLFPLAFITAAAFQRVQSKSLYVVALALTIPCFVYAQVRASIPTRSKATEIIGSYLKRVTRPEDLVLTNLKGGSYPFPAWDFAAPGSVAVLADRLVRQGIQTDNDVIRERQTFAGQGLRFLYLRLVAGEISQDLSDKLVSQGRLLDQTKLDAGTEPESPGGRLRSFYWKAQSRTVESRSGTDRGSRAAQAELELYELK